MGGAISILKQCILNRYPADFGTIPYTEYSRSVPEFVQLSNCFRSLRLFLGFLETNSLRHRRRGNTTYSESQTIRPTEVSTNLYYSTSTGYRSMTIRGKAFFFLDVV